MSSKQGNATIVGVGVAACAACCAGPILGFLVAIGLGAAAGLAVFGAVAILLGGSATLFVLARHRRRTTACAFVDAATSVPVALTDVRTRS